MESAALCHHCRGRAISHRQRHSRHGHRPQPVQPLRSKRGFEHETNSNRNRWLRAGIRRGRLDVNGARGDLLVSRLKLKYIMPIRKPDGRTYYYFRRKKSVTPLPGLPGSAEFMDAYAAAI